MHCAFCDRPIKPKSAWKGASNNFYCSEFCADSEPTAAAPADSRRENQPTLLDHHVSRPYERLEKLLPYMRQLSGRAAAAAQQ